MNNISDILDLLTRFNCKLSVLIFLSGFICCNATAENKAPGTIEKNEDSLSFIQDYSVDQLRNYIDYLWAISNRYEAIKAEEVLRENDSVELAHYFKDFWIMKDSTSPIRAWHNYWDRVKEANDKFGNNLTEGYRTERGRVYLKYGEPNQITEPMDPRAMYDFEIWYYNYTEKYSDIEFVFYNPTGMNNDFELVHSNMPGEIKNPQWKAVIYSRGNRILNDGFINGW